MPHLVILYTANLDAPLDAGGTDMTQLCRSLANTMIAARDEAYQAVFPVGGVRVLAYPAAHHAVADDGSAGRAAGGDGDYAFVYLLLRMARGRSHAVQQAVGKALEAVAKAHFASLLSTRHIGVTLNVDVGDEVFDARNSSLHPLFAAPASSAAAPPTSPLATQK